MSPSPSFQRGRKQGSSIAEKTWPGGMYDCSFQKSWWLIPKLPFISDLFLSSISLALIVEMVVMFRNKMAQKAAESYDVEDDDHAQSDPIRLPNEKRHAFL